ncbi:MAG: cysteine desulfurase family protein [Parachlamydiales bacterium]
MPHLYLDHHTTTPPSKRAIAAMVSLYESHWGNPAAPHPRGQELLPLIDQALGRVYRLLGARDSDNVILTSSGAEAVNHVVNAAYYELVREKGRDHFLTSVVDEAPVILSYERMETLGCKTTLIPINRQGIVTPDALIDALTPRTALLSLSWGNPMTGVIQPVQELAEICQDRGVWLHLDATHILGKLDFDLDEISPDFVSFNGDQIGAPAGTGALWIRAGLRTPPLILGAQDQNGLRAGPLSLPLLTALSIACEERLEGRDPLCLEIAPLRDRLEQGLISIGGTLPFADSPRLPTTTCVAFPGVTSDALLYTLAKRGVYASFGGGSCQQLSLQLEAAGLPHPVADCAITLTLGPSTTAAEIDEAILRITSAVHDLKTLSQVFFDG